MSVDSKTTAELGKLYSSSERWISLSFLSIPKAEYSLQSAIFKENKPSVYKGIFQLQIWSLTRI